MGASTKGMLIASLFMLGTSLHKEPLAGCLLTLCVLSTCKEPMAWVLVDRVCHINMHVSSSNQANMALAMRCSNPP